MADLSPQAQAVITASNCAGSRIVQLHIAAALRAAADQVVPDEPHPELSQFWDNEADQEWQQQQHFRAEILAIATELENHQ